MSAFELTGLKGHHPLGFLAACGLLRCVTQWKHFGWSKLGWIITDHDGSFATINAERFIDIEALTEMLLCLSEQQRSSPAWTWSTKIDDRNKYREGAEPVLAQLFEGTSQEAADMFAALASDLVAEGDALRSTSFDLTSGNQRLLQSFRILAGAPEKAKGQPSPLTKASVEEALVGPWKYQDSHHSLGWDPQSQRLHALRGKLPEKDKENRSVRAAVFLATQALPLFPCFAIGGRLRTTGFHRHEQDDWFAWPVWKDQISLDTLRSLLAHPFRADLKDRGVETVYRCRRTHTGGSEGNYQVLSHPEERAWPLRHLRRSGRTATEDLNRPMAARVSTLGR